MPAKKGENINTLDFLEVEKITKDILITKDKYIRILKILPINYDLKSDFEKKSIITAYKRVFKTCDFDFQILILSQKENIDINIEILNDKFSIREDILSKDKIFNNDNKNLENEKLINNKINRLKFIYSNYINFIKRLNEDENITSKSFYIIIHEKREIEKKNQLFREERVLKKRGQIAIKDRKTNKNGLHKNSNKLVEKDLKTYAKALNNKENKLINTLSKCGNLIHRLEKEEIYELFNFSKKGGSYF